MIATVLVLAISGAAPAPLVLADAVTVSGDALRLSDLADLSVLPAPLARCAEGVVVARLDQGASSVSAREAAARARAALPGLSPWLPDGPDRVIAVERRDTTPVSKPAPVAAAVVDADRLTPQVRAGENLTVRMTVGPVVVERSARALQDGWAGRSVFARTADGAVLSVRLGGDGT